MGLTSRQLREMCGEDRQASDSIYIPECEHGLSLSLCAGPMHYPPDEEGPPATMSEAAGQYHAQGLPCPFDCAACDRSGEYEAMQAPAYEVQTSYGILPAASLAEAKTIAREAAIATGRRTTIKKMQEA